MVTRGLTRFMLGLFFFASVSTQVLAIDAFWRDCQLVFAKTLGVEDYVSRQFSHFEKAMREEINVFLVTRVLADPTFQADPVKYLQDWESYRGGTEELRIPEDPALDFLRDLHRQGQLVGFGQRVKNAGLDAPLPTIEPFSQVFRRRENTVGARMVSAEETRLLGLVDSYLANGQSMASDKATLAQVRLAIVAVLQNPEFHRDPVACVQATFPRGGFDVIRYPETPARRFFETLEQARNLKMVAMMAKDIYGRPAEQSVVAPAAPRGMAAVNEAAREAASVYGESAERLGAELRSAIRGIAINEIVSIDWTGALERMPPIHLFTVRLSNGTERAIRVSLLTPDRAPASAPPAISPLVTSAVAASLARASSTNPVVIKLSVFGVESADRMERALRSFGARVEGEGYPLESYPPQGGRTVTIVSQQQAEALKRVLADFPDAIFRLEVAAAAARPAESRLMPGEIVYALARASAARPVVISMQVRGVESADRMDRDLRSFGARVEGEGFPLESLPPQGGRTVTIVNQQQAEAFKRVVADYPDAISSLGLEP